MKNTILQDDPIKIEHAVILIFSDEEEIQMTDKQYAELILHCTNDMCKNCINKK
jgi:hypothetical protein